MQHKTPNCEFGQGDGSIPESSHITQPDSQPKTPRLDADKVNMKIQSQSGFTLVEVVVAMSIAAILLGVGIPSFVSAVQNSRQSSTYQSLIGALFLARSEAVKRAGSVTVCSRATSASCGDSTQWANGWLVFTEEEGAGNEFGRLDPGEVVLAIQEEIDQNEITVYAKRRGSNSTSDQGYIQYSLIGGSSWRGGTLQVCDKRGDKKALAMNVVITGDIRKARSDGSSDSTPVGFDGAKVSC